MKTGRLIEDSFEDLFLNLAIEQALVNLHSKSDFDFTVRLWRNPPSVIIGRGQNLEKEVNFSFCEKNNIIIGRRISGGGAVYQDEGNLNISFFINRSYLQKEKNLEAMRHFFTSLLALSIEKTGYKVEIYKNSILYNNKKVSGSAGYLLKDNYLHHATLLISADLDKLEKSLYVKDIVHGDSRSSEYLPTTNLDDFNLEIWKMNLLSVIQVLLGFELKAIPIDDKELSFAKKLSKEIYSSTDWIWKGKRS